MKFKKEQAGEMSGESIPPFKKRSKDRTAVIAGLVVRKDKKVSTQPTFQTRYSKPRLASGGEVGGLYPPDIYYYNR